MADDCTGSSGTSLHISGTLGEASSHEGVHFSPLDSIRNVIYGCTPPCAVCTQDFCSGDDHSRYRTPEVLGADGKVDTEGIDIVLAMDVSTSMLARDLTPDRISASKDIAIEFISQRPSDRMGIVVFAGESFTQCPLTTDRATLINLMKEVQTDIIEDGTAIGNGLATAVARMKDSDAKSRVVILLTDGVNNRGEISPQMAAEIARTYGVRVYTIGVGKEGMAPYPVMTPWGVEVQNVKVEIDEKLLAEIAESTGGRYFRATDNTKLAEIYGEINKMEKARTTVDSFPVYKELFGTYALLALLALLLELLLNWFVIRRLP